jgi:uncharacterized protein YbjQ (UPF0145 family)
MTRPPIDPKKSLRNVERGGIPLRAEQRLAEESSQRLFTSDLSVAEFVLSREAGCRPVAQVMGSSIYQVGQIDDYKGATAEITSISDAHREARRLALTRLAREAALVKADAVIGVHLRERMITMGAQGKGGDDGGEVLEFTAIGTAVRASWITHEPGQPVVTDLSGQDLWALYQEGYEPCGFLFEFCRYHVFHVTSEFPSTGELGSASDAVEEARAIAERKLTEQAAALGAEFVVGSDIKLSVREVPCGFESCERNDLDVDVVWFATGIRRIPGAQRGHRPAPPMILSMVPLGRRRSNDIHAEDDADEVAEAAEEAREAAVLAEEGAL